MHLFKENIKYIIGDEQIWQKSRKVQKRFCLKKIVILNQRLTNFFCKEPGS